MEVNWDISNSMTYFTKDAKSNTVEFVTKLFDSTRDKKMTNLCSLLIWNIVAPRRHMFLKTEEQEPVEILLFDDRIIDESSKSTVAVTNLRHKITSVNNPIEP
jgi:hypothetical protein